MITVRQIQRLWDAKAYTKLVEQLTAPRPAASKRLTDHLCAFGGGAVAAAAVAVIRLDELNQPFVPVYSDLVRQILAAQLPDGGWGDVLLAAMCIRALLCGQGHGIAIDRGLTQLADLQKPEGIWPSIPVRRMPADVYDSALVLSQLGDSEKFRSAVRFDDALDWFQNNELALDSDSAKLWAGVKRRMLAFRRSTHGSTANANRQLAERSSGVPMVSSGSKSFWDFSAALSA